MKINNVRTYHSPDMVVADLLFGADEARARPAVRIDQYCDALLDCIDRLERDGVHAFLDPNSVAYLRLVRNGEEVLVQPGTKMQLPKGPRKLKYAKLRAGILVALDLCRDQLDESVPSHPEARRVQARLEAIGAG